MKGYLAEGSLDPYGYGTDEDGNLVYDIYNAIENAENAYEEAPEEKQLQEVPAKLNLEKEDGQGGTYIDENRFMGTAKTEGFRLCGAVVPHGAGIGKRPDYFV